MQRREKALSTYSGSMISASAARSITKMYLLSSQCQKHGDGSPVRDPPVRRLPDGKSLIEPADKQEYYFRGCYGQGRMEGEMAKKSGDIDQEAWSSIMALKKIMIV